MLSLCYFFGCICDDCLGICTATKLQGNPPSSRGNPSSTQPKSNTKGNWKSSGSDHRTSGSDQRSSGNDHKSSEYRNFNRGRTKERKSSKVSPRHSPKPNRHSASAPPTPSATATSPEKQKQVFFCSINNCTCP